MTPFKKVCAKSDYLYKQCPSNNKCIKRELFCDGVINCDGEEKDEKEEYCLRGSILPGSGIFMSFPVIIIVVIVSLVVLLSIIVFCKVTIAFFNSGPETEERRVEAIQQPVTVSARDTVPATGSSRSGVAQRNIRDHDPGPSAPVMLMNEGGPYMSPLPPSYN